MRRTLFALILLTCRPPPHWQTRRPTPTIPAKPGGAALLEAVYPGRVRAAGRSCVSLFWNATAVVRDPCGHRRRRNGRRVSRKGYQIAAGCSDQSIAASFCKRSGSHGAIRAARPRCRPSSTIRLSRPFMASKTGAGRVAGGSGDAVAPSVHRHQAAVCAAGSRGARLCARARRATIRSWLPSPHACLPIRDMATYVQVDNPALGGHQPIASAWRLYVPKPVGLPPEGRILWAERKTHGAGAHDQETNP